MSRAAAAPRGDLPAPRRTVQTGLSCTALASAGPHCTLPRAACSPVCSAARPMSRIMSQPTHIVVHTQNSVVVGLSVRSLLRAFGHVWAGTIRPPKAHVRASQLTPNIPCWQAFVCGKEWPDALCMVVVMRGMPWERIWSGSLPTRRNRNSPSGNPSFTPPASDTPRKPTHARAAVHSQTPLCSVAIITVSKVLKGPSESCPREYPASPGGHAALSPEEVLRSQRQCHLRHCHAR